MDEMKLKLSTKFMRGMLAKIIAKVVFKKFGFKPELQINEIEAELKDGKIRFHINADGEIDEKVFIKANQLIEEES